MGNHPLAPIEPKAMEECAETSDTEPQTMWSVPITHIEPQAMHWSDRIALNETKIHVGSSNVTVTYDYTR